MTSLELIDEASPFPPHKEEFDPRDLTGYPGDRPETIDHLLNLGFLEGKMGVSPASVAVIVDRGPLNLAALGDFAELHPGKFSVGGVIAPGSELDSYVPELLHRTYGNIDDDLVDIHALLRPGRHDSVAIDKGDYELTYEGHPFFRFVHEAYEAKRLRLPGREGEIEREEYCDRLTLQLLNMNPSLIFLDNFKVFLAPNIVRQFPGRIINIHPSVLPLIKGFRPEKRAYEGEHPQANGYTLHVVNESMDGGPTLFQQHVPVLSIDKAMLSKLGETEYKKYREEQARLRIMVAQARFVPWVLAIYNTDIERRVVEGADAFRAEGRPGFESSETYREISAHESDKPYQRMLFRNPCHGVFSDAPEWVTLENLLTAPATSDIPDAVTGIHDYKFSVPANNGLARFTAAVTDMERNGLTPEFAFNLWGGSYSVELRALGSCAVDLANHGIGAVQERHPVHVLAPRKPIQRREVVLPNLRN